MEARNLKCACARGCCLGRTLQARNQGWLGIRRPPANSINPVRNYHFRSRHSSPPLQTYIRRRLFHGNGCSLLHAAERLGSRRFLQAPPGSSRQSRRSLFATQSVPAACRTSEAIWQVYIARQSSPGLIGGQAIQRSFSTTLRLE
jgi:hypothetical protein